MTQTLFDQDQMDVDPELLPPKDAAERVFVPEVVDEEAAETAHALAIQESLPPGFNLLGLLRFLPDVRMKQRLDSLASEAKSLKVKGGGADAVIAADGLLARIRAGISEITSAFEEPASLANQLHKRLTGLRADFVKNGSDALEALGRDLRTEQKRLEDVAREATRLSQVAADKQVKRDAVKAVKDAKASGAPPEVVEAMKTQAQLVTAPPVAPPIVAPTLASSTIVEKWRVRFKGTPDGAEPNPSVVDLNAQQEEMFMALLDAVRAGTVTRAALEINWSYLNKRAGSDKKAFSIPGLEAYDDGGTRSKSTRR